MRLGTSGCQIRLTVFCLPISVCTVSKVVFILRQENFVSIACPSDHFLLTILQIFVYLVTGVGYLGWKPGRLPRLR